MEPETILRPYEAGDFDDAARIWRDVGWITDDDDAEQFRKILATGHVGVGVVNGSAECLVHWTPGSLRHVETDLRLAIVSAVTTSLVGRKLGLASQLTRRALAEAADAGYAVASLGMFEQGFYDRLGFATGAYDHRFRFDPTTLLVDRPFRTPERLTLADHAEMHATMMNRKRSHGGVCVEAPESLAAELAWLDDPLIALGYRENGRLTSFIAGSLTGEHGPARIRWIAYETTDQLLELLRLIRELGDQIYTFELMEPPEVQLQVMLGEPFRRREVSKASGFASGHEASAWWQARILDVRACIEAVRSVHAPLAFNLTLTDPVAELPRSGWSGRGGDYNVILAASSGVRDGHQEGLPLLRADIGAFTRLWLGVGPASSLAVTDDFSAPAELIAALDSALRLPTPLPCWDF